MLALDLVRVIFYGLKKKTITPSKGKQKEKNQNRTKDYYNNKKQQLQQKVSCSWREHYTEPKLQVVTVINWVKLSKLIMTAM